MCARLVVAATALAVGLFAAPRAEGYVNNYCGWTVAANNWCGSGYAVKYYANSYDVNVSPGGGCEKLVGAGPNGSTRGSGPHCLPNSFYVWCYSAPGATAGDYYPYAKGTPHNGFALYVAGHAYYGVGGNVYPC
jgi:hypothetical protein